jgi:hypothetical protein
MRTNWQPLVCGPAKSEQPGALAALCDSASVVRAKPIPRRFALFLLAAISASCSTPNPEVVFYSVDGHHFSSAERRTIERIARATATEVRQILPTLADQLVLRVEAGKKVIPETGETASAHPPNVVYWTVDPNRPGGIVAIANAELRRTLFHEFHHLVRDSAVGEDQRLLDRVVTEGLATVFERDFAGPPPPWGMYPDDVETWVAEILALPADAPRSQWMVRHPDGRRWIGYKVGTYLVDRAIRASGRSAAALVSSSTDDILRLALTPEAQRSP